MRQVTNWVAASTTACALASLAYACGGTAPSPSTPSPPTPPPVATPTVTAVTITGTAPQVGSTAQFAATAALSNNTNQTVTTLASWQSSNAAVATVNGTGLVTGVAAGEADITASYQSVTGRSHVALAAPRTFILNGIITDGFSGGILPNINVLVIDSASGNRSGTTNASGAYSFSGLPGGTTSVSGSGSGYTTTTRSVTLAADARVDLVLPRLSSGGGGGGGGGGATLTCNGVIAPAIVDCPNNGGRQPPTAACNDGSYSCSQNRSGTCSSHGGVRCYVCPGPLC